MTEIGHIKKKGGNKWVQLIRFSNFHPISTSAICHTTYWLLKHLCCKYEYDRNRAHLKKKGWNKWSNRFDPIYLTEIGHTCNLPHMGTSWKSEYDRNRAYLCLEIHCVVPDQYVRCKYDRNRAYLEKQSTTFLRGGGDIYVGNLNMTEFGHIYW